MNSKIAVGLNAVIAAVTDETPRILTVNRMPVEEPEDRLLGPEETNPGLPYGPLDPARDRTLELALRRWVRDQGGIELGYVEQLYTFGDLRRDPRFFLSQTRVISVAYLALVRETVPPGRDASWRDWYRFLPWEDWREGRPAIIPDSILPTLQNWIESSGSEPERRHREERVDLAFGCHGVAWNWERALDRYELLYESELVPEARRDNRIRQSLSPKGREGESAPRDPRDRTFGLPMILDHRRILATALDRLRGKLKYRPVVFELLPPTFTLFQLQRIVESLAGARLHKQNFRRLVAKSGLVEKAGQVFHDTGGRPAELFRFRRDVLRERPAPGVGLPIVH